jgi:hypothetical protein
MLIGMAEDGFAHMRSQTPSQRLIALPSSIESRCSLPATDVKSLEALDSALNTSETLTELVSLLTTSLHNYLMFLV